ncbi:MAG: type II secretion system protein [Deferribacterales bacterium]
MNQKGFTLVELAIVLVIIGVILGGVIKGQELVNSAKVKGLYREFQQVEYATFGYYDRFNQLPGDNAGDNDSLIETGVTVGSGSESTQFWADVTANGFYSGPDGTTLPTHTYGGDISVESVLYGFTKNAVCFTGINATDALRFDTTFDDGISDTGTIRGATTGTAAATDDYATAGASYKICIQLD